MENKELINKFYGAFAAGDAEGMLSCYHDDIQFEDPAFGILKGNEAKSMWRMLIKNSKGNIKITYNNIQADDKTGSAHWEAVYVFSKTGRNVVNKVDASFEFKDGKIIKHTDRFDFWKWAGQALGLTGSLLGWTPFLKNKVRKNATDSLSKFISQVS
jgi:ketosteroid isomerase-like protein